MKLENSFTIDAPVEKAWEALNTPETVAPCFPGATLTKYEGDSFTGTVKVKLGPIAMTYKGKGTYVTRDAADHRVVIEASGRDSRGNGTANATVTASLAADGDRTAVTMVTDMTITGKPAQFGRGVISDVADKIINQFSACVARKLAPAADAAGEPAGESTGAGSTAASTGAAAEQAPVPVPAAASATAAVAEAPGPEAPGPEATAEAPARSTPVPSGGSELAAEAVAERVASNGTAANGTAANGTAANGTGAPETPQGAAPAAATLAPAPTTARPAAPAGPVRSEVDAIDLLDTAGAPVLRRLAPVAGGGLLLLLVILLVRRLRAS
jgi:carbon monoxide dehydrogenase subunit G